MPVGIYSEEYNTILSIISADEGVDNSLLEACFLRRRGSSDALKREYVIDNGTKLCVEDFIVHSLAFAVAGLATKAVFKNNQSDLGLVCHNFTVSKDNFRSFIDLTNKLSHESSFDSVYLFANQDIKNVYYYSSDCFQLQVQFAVSIFESRAGCSTLDFVSGQSFLAGGGNSLVAPKF